MKIDPGHLKRIAHLSRLEVDEKDIPQLLADMNEVLQWVEQLKHVPTDGVEPLTSMAHEVNNLREDFVGTPLDKSEALAAAPDKDADYFRVPRVLDNPSS